MEWFERIFWIIAIPFSLIFLLQLARAVLGADADMEADFEGDLGGDIGGDVDDVGDGHGFQVFTIRNFVILMTVFGWSGITFLDQGFGKGATLIISLINGLIAMFAVVGIFYFFGRMTESGTINLKNAINHVGEVYLPIRAKRGNMGKVQITIQGSIREITAVTDEEVDLPTGTVVRIVQVLNNSILLVRKS